MSRESELRAKALGVVLSNLFILQDEQYQVFVDIDKEYELWLDKYDASFDGNSYLDPEDKDPPLSSTQWFLGLKVDQLHQKLLHAESEYSQTNQLIQNIFLAFPELA